MKDEQITLLLKRNLEDKCAVCNNALPKDPSLVFSVVSEELIVGVAESAVKICASHPRPKAR